MERRPDRYSNAEEFKNGAMPRWSRIRESLLASYTAEPEESEELDDAA